ncbi:minor tail protein [Mycobacterium phage DS6A]|uniref:Minor tail subunit n=1 Tax=Mycobacterium phage DS6A TaxID=45764 RepID=G8I4D1_9CAUD|nr:minor tail protein [Mycobacterium phage DS6A]AER47575.1 minor tail subunit [Mycobacterium phage DS6A]
MQSATAVIDYEPVTLDFGMSLEAQCAAILAETEKQKRAEQMALRVRPSVLVWDGDWNLQHIMAVEYKAQFSWISNDTGPGMTELPFNAPVAQWIHDMQGRIDRGEKRNVHITVDYSGARWAGRMDSANVKLTDDGDKSMEVTWLHDYENLKWYSVWSNSWLPAAFQWPRAFILGGPVPWVLKTALWSQVVREHNPLITIPDDPLDFGSWFTSLDQSTWQLVVAPGGFLDGLEAGDIWGVCSSRWSNWHDMAKQPLEDGEYSVTTDRYLPALGDPEPWEGANLRPGALVVDVVNKSGFHLGTSNGGTIFDGLALTVAEFAEDFIDSTLTVITDDDLAPGVKEAYGVPGLFYTQRELPYVIYREDQHSAVQSSEFITSPAKGVQVNCGGHSMPGVNEAISASIQAAADILGGLIQIGSLGGSIDALVKPLYEDTILAFWSVKSTERAQKSGWSRYFEYWQDGANKAYTLASLMVLRAGFWATKTTISCKVSVENNAPYRVGGPGVGHFWLDDRIGIVLKDDIRGRIHMDRCRNIVLAWDENDNYPAWQLTIGDDRALQDPAQRAWAKIENIVAALKELGVY